VIKALEKIRVAPVLGRAATFVFQSLCLLQKLALQVFLGTEAKHGLV